MKRYDPRYWLTPTRRTPEYEEALRVQLRYWVNGVWRHNTYSQEHTPDLGCCKPELKELNEQERYDWAERIRQRMNIGVVGVKWE
jgi:hypothetical protein